MKWLFNFIRNGVAQAVLSGVADALDQLDGDGQPQPQAPTLPEAIRSRLALSASAEEPAANGKRKKGE